MNPDVEKILHGDQLAGSRLMRLLEDRDPRGIEMLKAVYPHAGKAFLVGITGPAGAGKSTLVSRMISCVRGRGLRVGVVAVDPSSPFTGGALLGDRIRMQGHETDPGVFIRSMAARGQAGGVSRATREVALVMDAMGYQVVLIETVGIGQGEVAVSSCVHTTAVVSIPGMGDEIQAMKAGVLETGDVFVVNKADRDGADRTVLEIEMMLEHGESDDGWRPKIFKTVASRGEGIDALTQGILGHREFLFEEEGHRRKGRERTRWVFRGLLQERLTARALDSLSLNSRTSTSGEEPGP